MPAKKPLSLIQRHSTQAEIDQRVAAEAAMTPTTQLSTEPPPLLQKHRTARGVWSRLMELYLGVQGTLITAFDQDLLIVYCLLEEECIWLEGKRAEVDQLSRRVNKLMATKEKAKQLDGETYTALLQQYSGLLTRVQGLDARLDGKRKLIHSLAQSLFLTPRSRAGVAPARREPAEPDEFGTDFD